MVTLFQGVELIPRISAVSKCVAIKDGNRFRERLRCDGRL